ncbi:MAG: NAD(P)/FAD-dependent oxidoreductase, partial [Xenococcaceae cyanobacterium]
MNNEPIKICILGGGFGGLYTALYLSSFAWVKSGRCQIVLVEPKDNFLFSPLLYEVLTGELKRWEIAPSYEKLLAGKRIEFCRDVACEVDLKSRRVELGSGENLDYDYLVLAVGNKAWFPEIPGLSEYGLGFRSLADADRLEERLRVMEASDRQRLRVTVIGGGANGVELACKLHDRLLGRVNVCLIERGEEILKGFSVGVKKAAKRAIERRAIEVCLNTEVKEIEADKIVLNRGGEVVTFPIDLVLWTAGTESIEWVSNLNCQKSDRGKLLTRPTLQLVDYPEVFALGDLAEVCSNKKRFIPATAQAAFQQASCAAKNLKALMLGESLGRFRYLHLGDMLTLG